MAKRDPEPEKRPGFFSQLKSLFRFTREVYSWLPWAQIAILVVGILLGLVVGYLIPPFQVWTLVLWAITGLMVGVLAFLVQNMTNTLVLHARIGIVFFALVALAARFAEQAQAEQASGPGIAGDAGG